MHLIWMVLFTKNRQKKKNPKERSCRREERKRQRVNATCLRSHCKGRSGNHFFWLLLFSLDNTAMQQNLHRAEEQAKIRIALPIYIFMSLFPGLYWNYTNVFLKKEGKQKGKTHSVFERRHEPFFVCSTWNIYLYILTMSIYSPFLRNITLSCLNHCNWQWGRLAEISSGSHLESFSSSALQISFPQRIKILLLSPLSGERNREKREYFQADDCRFAHPFQSSVQSWVMMRQFLGMDELCPGCMGMERSGQSKGRVGICCQGWCGVGILPACWWLCLSWSLPALKLP